MSTGGQVPPSVPQSDDLEGIKDMLKKASQDDKPQQASSGLKIDLTKPDLDAPNSNTKGIFMTERFAKGGVAASNDNTPHKAPEGPSDAEKKEFIKKAMSEGRIKMSDGGAPTDPSLPADANQESKLAAIWDAIKGAGSDAISSVLPGTQSLTDAVAPSAASAATTPGIAPAINAVTGGSLQDSTSAFAPIALDSVPPPSAPLQVPPHTAPQSGNSVSAQTTPDPLAQLGKFDPTTVAPGMNPGDRQALAGQLNANQHTFGNYLAQAMSGIGDALAARGGVQQNSLGDIIALQKQQRDEALGNFDKAREAAVQNHTMKMQADQDLINNVKARGETLVSPDIAKSMGHPEWGNKPVAQVSLALNGQKAVLDYTNQLMQRKQSALKDSADSVEHALAHGGIGGFQKMLDPQSRLKMIYSNAIQNDPEAFGYKIQETGK